MKFKTATNKGFYFNVGATGDVLDWQWLVSINIANQDIPTEITSSDEDTVTITGNLNNKINDYRMTFSIANQTHYLNNEQIGITFIDFTKV